MLNWMMSSTQIGSCAKLDYVINTSCAKLDDVINTASVYDCLCAKLDDVINTASLFAVLGETCPVWDMNCFLLQSVFHAKFANPNLLLLLYACSR